MHDIVFFNDKFQSCQILKSMRWLDNILANDGNTMTNDGGRRKAEPGGTIRRVKHALNHVYPSMFKLINRFGPQIWFEFKPHARGAGNSNHQIVIETGRIAIFINEFKWRVI